MQQGEIVIYKTTDKNDFQLEVRVEDETVWLTQAQMADLFQTTRNNVTLHISNVFKENELQENSVCKDSLLTASDGKKYKTKLYNLDVIISVGYRVKSKRGTQFRPDSRQNQALRLPGILPRPRHWRPLHTARPVLFRAHCQKIQFRPQHDPHRRAH